ncbi:hypothetical protein MKX01_014222, partial [Papaver californicum]
ATMAIYDVLQLVRADVSTVALGIATSTTAIILGDVTKGICVAMPKTRIMVHQPLGAVEFGIIDGCIDSKNILPLMPVPDKVKSRFSYEEIIKDPKKFLPNGFA